MVFRGITGINCIKFYISQSFCKVFSCLRPSECQRTIHLTLQTPLRFKEFWPWRITNNSVFIQLIYPVKQCYYFWSNPSRGFKLSQKIFLIFQYWSFIETIKSYLLEKINDSWNCLLLAEAALWQKEAGEPIELCSGPWRRPYTPFNDFNGQEYSPDSNSYNDSSPRRGFLYSKRTQIKDTT